MTKFEVGKGYWATECVSGKRAVIVSLGRVDGVTTFARIRDFGEVRMIMTLDGREFAQVVFGDGVWTASSSVEADVMEARRVIEAVVGKG